MNDQSEIEFVKPTIQEIFISLPTAELIQKKKIYEHLLLIESGNYNPGEFNAWEKKKGKRPYPSRMPWMIPSWEKGLRILNEVLNNRIA